MSGGLMQLVAYGAQDVYLTGNPQITFFKVAYRRHTNFAMQTMNVVASGSSGFDKIMNFTIPRNGDLIMNTYLRAQIRDIDGDDKTNDTVNKFAWCKRLGHALIDYATLTIGGSQIDKQYGMWLDMWYELTHKKSQEKGYKQMIGEVPEMTKFSTVAEGKRGYTLFVPLQFWFCRNPGLALPLIALQYHEVKIELKIARKEHLIVCSRDFKTTDTYKQIELGDVSLLVNYVFLDSEERRKFAQVGHEYLIEQLQFTGSTPVPQTLITTKDTEIHHAVQLNFNHPSKELVWAVRNGNTRGGRFLAYTADEDWSAALDDAADNLMAGVFKVFPDTIDDERYVDVSDETELKKFHDMDITVKSPEGETCKVGILKHFAMIGPFTLSKKIKSVSVEVLVETDATTQEKTYECIADVYSHELTVRDISIPIDKWTFDGRDKEQTNDIIVQIPFNYGMLIDGSINPVHKAFIQFNGQDRFDEREGLYFNSVQPFQHHTTTPADGINVYSFAINPENHQPSGTANLSRIDTTFLQLKYKDGSQKTGEASMGYFNSESQLFVFDFNYNVLRIMSGMGGLAYSN